MNEQSQYIPSSPQVASRKTSAREDRKIINLAMGESRILLQTLGKVVRNQYNIELSNKSIARRLHEANLYGRIARKKPLLRKRHIQHRLRWCRERENWTSDQWGKVLWSDESKFCLVGTAGCQRVWRKPGETLKPDCIVSTVKHGGGKGCNTYVLSPYIGISHYPVFYFDRKRHGLGLLLRKWRRELGGYPHYDDKGSLPRYTSEERQGVSAKPRVAPVVHLPAG